MSQLFLPRTEGFALHALTSDRYRMALDRVGMPCAEALASGPPARDDTLLLRVPGLPTGADAGFAVLAGRDERVWLNGEPLVLGIALLRHRDELRIPGAEPLYYSTERLPTVLACVRDDRPRCPRCAQTIDRGELSVCCPGCGVLHHQRADRPCWSYSASCARCEQPSDLGASLSWTPEGL